MEQLKQLQQQAEEKLNGAIKQLNSLYDFYCIKEIAEAITLLEKAVNGVMTEIEEVK